MRLAFDYAVFPGAAQIFEVPGPVPSQWLKSESPGNKPVIFASFCKLVKSAVHVLHTSSSKPYRQTHS